jgi:hypothetical protein
MTGGEKRSRRLLIQRNLTAKNQPNCAEQFEFVFATTSQSTAFRQIEFPFRYRISRRRRQNFEEFKQPATIVRRKRATMPRPQEKELAVRARRLSKEGCRLLELMNEAEVSVYRNVNLANYRVWHFGKFLARAKAELGHGQFTIWRAATFPNVHERKAQRCQELFAKNSKATELSDFSDRSIAKWIANRDENSIRKFRLGYVPAKDQTEHKGNVKFGRLVSFLNIANEYARLKQRHVEGLQRVDFDEAREEMREPYQFLRWLYGHTPENPWEG